MVRFTLRDGFAAVCFPVLLATFAGPAAAAISVSTTAYTQNFDGMGTAAAATLPTDFRVDKLTGVRTLGTFAAALTATSLAAGPNVSTTASNGIYNFGAGTTATGTDRAVGFISSGTATQSGNLYAQLVNNTSGGFGGLQLSYGVEKYRHGSNAAGFRIQLFYSTDGSTWTSAGSGFLTSFVADTDNTGFATVPGATVAVTGTLNVNIPAGSTLYLAWNYSVASGTTTTNAQGLAIDDISITGVGGVTPTNPTAIGLAKPSTVQAGSATLLTVTVTPGTNPTSTGIAITADLSAIGGSATQQFVDDGTQGDAVAGDNVFSFSATVPGNASSGAKSLPVAFSDGQSRSGTTSIAVTVTPLTTSPKATGSATPNSVQPGGSSLLTVTVTAGTNPASTGIAVTGDLSSIGGVAGQQFYDDGTHGDVTAGDNIFSLTTTVSGSAGVKPLPISITDGQARTGTTTVSVSILPPMTVKLSQVYGGGGNSGSTFTNDFIEIFNASGSTVDISTWSVQQTSSGGTTWNVTPVCATAPCLLGAGQYWLTQESQGAGGTTPLPAPDASGTLNLGSTSGKVALVAVTDALTGNCPTGGAIVDFLGYGTGAGGCAEASPTGALTNTSAAVRVNNGCVDTDNNNNDFQLAGPIPRNSTAPVNFCGGDPNRLSGLGTASPVSIEPGSLLQMTVKVSPASSPASTGITVTADLTAIGGPAGQIFYDDGTHGDGTAGDNTFSFEWAVGVQIPFGVKYLVAKLADAQSRNGTAPITVTVQSPTCGVERWSVKTGGDPDAGLVNLVNPVHGTIQQLRSITAPATPPDNARVFPTEGTEYVVNGTITVYKKETDVDYHIVLQDTAGNTMVTEIPSPACVVSGSPFATGIANARAKFDAKLTALPDFQTANLMVQMKGVAFFDFIHGQTGVAPNGIELHPLLDISFTTVTTTSLTLSQTPATFGQQVTYTAKVATAASTTPTGQVTLFDGAAQIATNMLDPTGQATFNVSNLTGGPHSLTASYEGDSASAPSVSAILTQTITKANQTITFAQPAGRTYGDADFPLTATTTANLPVGFSMVSGPATVTVNVVHLTGAGTVTIRASQAGDGNYIAAANVDQTFAVAMGNQTITFAALADKMYGDAPFPISATGGGGSQPVVFTASGACTVAGNTVTITTAGSCTITASQAGDANFNDATQVPRLFTINKGVQGTVSVTAPSDATYGQTGLTATASGGNGTGAFVYGVGSSAGCSVNASTGAITVTSGAGTCLISASRAGDANYSDSAASTPAAVSVHKATSTAALTVSNAMTTFGQPVVLRATVASAAGTPSGSVTFLDGVTVIGSMTVTSGQAMLTGVVLMAGMHSVTAVYSGDANFATATSSAVPTVVGITCDFNSDQMSDVTDVQVIVNEALGAVPAVHDLNLDGLVNIADVQKEINVVLGMSCKTSAQ